MMDSEAATGRVHNPLSILAVFVLAVLARSLDFQRVFPAEGETIFAVGDAYYHARRALFSFENFPALLLFDPCINYPDGARIPHPPLLDWGSAALAQMWIDSRVGFERWAAWLPVLLTSLSVLPIAALGRRLRGPNTGLLAAAIYAVMPICVNYGQLGNFDHHALVGLLGACLLLLYVSTLDDSAPQRSLDLGIVALVAVRLGLLFSWTGSLLYLIPGEAAILLWASMANRPRALARQAIGCGLTALVLAPAVAALRPGGATSFVAVELSQFHTLFFAGTALLAAAQVGFGRARGPGWAALQLSAISLPLLLGALLIPGVAEGIAAALSFLATNDGYSQTVIEQLPVFWEKGSLSFNAAHIRMGLFVYLIPVVPFVFWRRYIRSPSQAGTLLLMGWSLLFGFLAVQQVRYVHDYAPAGCVGFALIFAEIADWVHLRGGSRTRSRVVAGMLAVVFMGPALVGYHLPVTGLAISGLRGKLDSFDNALLSIAGTQLRFAESVRGLTEDTGECGPHTTTSPDYGVLAHVALGHVLHYSAHRATPADPFGPYIGEKNFAAVERFMNSEDEVEAVSIMRALNTRYLATALDGLPRSPNSMLQRLHVGDGSRRRGTMHLGRFRLIDEAPTGGTPMTDALLDGETLGAPYKLFELVRGATLRVEAQAHSLVTGSLPLETPGGRRFVFRIAARADSAGTAVFRLPYPSRDARRTDAAPRRVRALGPYRLVVDERVFSVRVAEALVRDGGEVSLSTDSRF